MKTRRVVVDAISQAGLPRRGDRNRRERRGPLARRARHPHVRRRGCPCRRRHAVRPRVAHQGHRDDHRRDGPRGSGALRLDERVSTFFGDWRGADRESVTVRDLLEHASGLPARLLDAPRPAGASSSTTSARRRSSTRRARGRSTAISGSSCWGFSRRIEAARRWMRSSTRSWSGFSRTCSCSISLQT